jgi:hypothetical protein
VDPPGSQESISVPCDHAFVLIGAEIPTPFLKSLGITMENEWNGSLSLAAALVLVTLLGLWIFGRLAALGSYDLVFIPRWAGAVVSAIGLAALVFRGTRGDRFAWLGVSFLICYTIYGAKLGTGHEFWPFRDWGFRALSFGQRPWSFWYTVLYTTLMTLFGIKALKRWGLDRKDKFQIWRYVSLLSFQWIFFFLVPEVLFQWAIKYQWVGARLASDPGFAHQAGGPTVSSTPGRSSSIPSSTIPPRSGWYGVCC